eukprot:SAG22_NODE_3845_length_1505_cov_1.332859_1_plen_135_part_10
MQRYRALQAGSLDCDGLLRYAAHVRRVACEISVCTVYSCTYIFYGRPEVTRAAAENHGRTQHASPAAQPRQQDNPTRSSPARRRRPQTPPQPPPAADRMDTNPTGMAAAASACLPAHAHRRERRAPGWEAQQSHQ